MKRIVCFGDSNTYGYDPRSYFGGRYPETVRWPDLLAKKTGLPVLNCGQNGREIPYNPDGYPFEQLLADDILIILLGSNDLLQTRSCGIVSARLETFLRSPLIQNHKILLIAPPPMQSGTWVTEEQLLSESRQLAEQYRALAARLQIPFADAGAWDIELTFDGVHFSEHGHHAFASGVLTALKPFLESDTTETE